VLGRAGRPASAQAVRRQDVETLRTDLREVTRLREREGELTGRLERARDEVDALESKRDGLEGRMREILSKAAPDDETTGDATREELLTRYTAGLEMGQRCRQLEAELIPEAASSVAPADWMSKRLDEKKTLEKNLSEILRRRPLDPEPTPEHSANHYLQEYRQVDEQLRKVQTERTEIFSQVGDLLRRYRDEGPKLTEECERLELARRRAARFSEAVRMAADLLQEISRESYEEWATALNERSNRALVHLNPAYRDLRFDTDLSFTLEDVATGRRLDRDGVDAFLSSGARDQIYMAIRLAVSDYFSAGRFRLPLILDDVLATADDERFDRALTFLAERVSQRHQLILVSCQEERHRRWRERHPELFEARLRTVALPAPELESV